MGNKTATEKRIENNLFKNSLMIDDPTYLRILDYEKENLFDAVIFELLLRTDGFKEIYNRLFDFVQSNKEQIKINPDVFINGIENIKFDGKNADIEEAYQHFLLETNETTPFMRKLKNEYGYEFQSLIKFISYLIDRYHNDNISSNSSLYLQTGYSKKNLLDTLIDDNHPFFELINNKNIKNEFYKFITEFDINIHKFSTGMIENLKFKKPSINLEIKLHKDTDTQNRELEKISNYLNQIKNKFADNNDNDLSIKIQKYINSPKRENKHILNHFYCYDLLQNDLTPNTIKRLTYSYLDKKDTQAVELKNLYDSIKPEKINESKKLISSLLTLINH